MGHGLNDWSKPTLLPIVLYCCSYSLKQPRQHIKKQRHYFTNKSPSSQSYGFSSSHYGCENRTIKKAELRRIDAFELWCWRRLLRVPWTARRSNQSILKEISPEYSLEGLMLKLKLKYFGYLIWRTNSWERTWCWERLKAGEGDDRRWDGCIASLTWWTSLSRLRELLMDREAWCVSVHGVAKGDRTRLSNWTDWLKQDVYIFIFLWILFPRS